MNKKLQVILSAILGLIVSLSSISYLLKFFAIDACLDSGGSFNYDLNLCLLGESGSDSQFLKPKENFHLFTLGITIFISVILTIFFNKLINIFATKRDKTT